MSNFSEVQGGLPPGFVNVPPEAWDSKWEDRPLEEVCIGLRFLSDPDLEDARIEAFRRAEKFFPRFRETEEERALFIASFNGALIRFVIARGTCNPNNVLETWEGWADAAEDIAVEQALTDHGAQLIFDKWEEMRIGADIGIRAATDEDLKLLPDLLRFLPVLNKLDRSREQRLRRLLRYVILDLASVAPEEASTRVDAEPSTDTE